MLGIKTIATSFIFIMIVSTAPLLLGDESSEEIETRWGNPPDESITERSISNLIAGSVVETRILDLTNDGIDDMFILGLANNGTNEYFAIIDLNTGAIYHYHMFEERLNVDYNTPMYKIIDPNSNGQYDIVFLQDDGASDWISVFRATTKAWMMYKVEYPGEVIYYNLISNELAICHLGAGGLLQVNAYTTATYPSPTWMSKRYPLAAPYFDTQFDHNLDGAEEIGFSASWGATNHYYFVIQISVHKEVLNSTDLRNGAGGFNYLRVIRDLSSDGYSEVMFFVNAGNSTSFVYTFTALPDAQSLYQVNWIVGNPGLQMIELTLITDNNPQHILFGDMNADTILDVHFVEIPPVPPNYIHHVLDGMNGSVLHEAGFDMMFGFYSYWFEDFTGDGRFDMFSVESIPGADTLTCRSWIGGTAIMHYVNVSFTFSQVVNWWVQDADGDGLKEFLLMMVDSSSGDAIYNFTVFDVSKFTKDINVEGINTGTGTLAKIKLITSPKGHAVLSFINAYTHGTNPDYKQLFFYNLTTPTIWYSSFVLPSENQLYDFFPKWNVEADLNNDGIQDFYYIAKWKSTTDSYFFGNVTILDGATFNEVYEFEAPNCDNAGDLDLTMFGMDHSTKDNARFKLKSTTDSITIFNNTIYDVSNWGFVPIWSQMENHDELEFFNHEVTGLGHPDLWVVRVSKFVREIEIFVYNPSNELMELKRYLTFPIDDTETMEIRSFNPEGDGDVTILLNSIGAVPNVAHIYETTNWVLTGNYVGIDMDLVLENVNNDRSLDLIINTYEWSQEDNRSNLFIHDLEDGALLWDSGTCDYFQYQKTGDFNLPLIRDIESDGKNEMILMPTWWMNWGSDYYYKVQTNDIFTNLEPQFLSPIPDIIVQEDTTNSSLDLDTHFSDDGNLTYEFTEITGMISFDVNSSNNVLSVTPEIDFAGQILPVDLKVTDGYWEILTSFQINVTAVNDVPVLLEINDMSLTDPDVTEVSFEDLAQEKWNNFSFLASDNDSEDTLVYSLEDVDDYNITIDNSTGFIQLKPEVDDGIEMEFNVLVTDSNGTTDEVTIKASVINANHAPFNVTILEPATGAVLEGKVNLTSSEALDFDIPWGDVLNYSWRSDVDGVLGYGIRLIGVNLTSGYHNITVTVVDTTGLEATDTVRILKNKTESIQVIPEPVWWDTGFKSGDKDEEINASVVVRWTKCEVKNIVEENEPKIGTNTMTTIYTFEGTCSDNVTVIHIYAGTQKNKEEFTYFSQMDLNNPGTLLEIEPTHGTWNWTHETDPIEFVPDLNATASEDVYSSWYAAVGWAPTGFNIDEIMVETVLDPVDDGEDNDTDITPQWWLAGFTTGDKDNDVDPTVKVKWTTCNVESTIEVDKPEAGKSTSTTTYTFEGTCSDDVTVVYIYFGSQKNDEAFTYHAQPDLDNLGSSLQIVPMDGKWSWTHTTDPFVFDTPDPVSDDDVDQPSDTFTSWYAAVAWAPTGFNIDETKIEEITAGNNTENDEDDTSISAEAFYGVLAGMIFFILLVIILIIILIVVASKKKSTDELAEPLEEELSLSEDELPPPEEELPPPPPEDEDDEIDTEELPPPEEYDDELLEEELDLSEDNESIEEDPEPPEDYDEPKEEEVPDEDDLEEEEEE